MTTTPTAGAALVERIVADMAARGLQPDAKERELLAVAEKLADQLDALERDVAANGVTVTIDSGRIVANPSVSGINQTSRALAAVLGQISMTTDPAVDRNRQRAAQARWAAKKAAGNARGRG